jgi:hypothetical protein
MPRPQIATEYHKHTSERGEDNRQLEREGVMETMTTETKCLHRYEYDEEKKAFYCVYCGQPMPPQVLEVPF